MFHTFVPRQKLESVELVTLQGTSFVGTFPSQMGFKLFMCSVRWDCPRFMTCSTYEV